MSYNRPAVETDWELAKEVVGLAIAWTVLWAWSRAEQGRKLGDKDMDHVTWIPVINEELD